MREGERLKKKNLSGRMGNPGDIFFCVAYGAKCQQAYLYTVCLCVSPFPLLTVIRRILMGRGLLVSEEGFKLYFN